MPFPDSAFGWRAQELVDACRDLLDIVEFEYEDDGEKEDLASWKRAISRARAAIAKAEGRSE